MSEIYRKPVEMGRHIPELTAADNFEGEKNIKWTRSQIVAGLAVSLALVGAGNSDRLAEASSVQSTDVETEVSEKKKRERCNPRKQIKLRLVELGEDPETGRANFRIEAKTCKKTIPKKLKNVRLVQQPEGGKKKVWKIKEFGPNKRKSRKFSLPLPSNPDEMDKNKDGKQTIILKALKKHKRVGWSKWDLAVQYYPEPGYDIEKSTEVFSEPDPDFRVGIQDDDVFVFQKYMSRENAFDIAEATFGATMLRINVIYGQYKEYGIQPYLDAVNAAKARGWEVLVTLMPTPKYYPQLDQDFGYQNMDPNEAKQFATEVAGELGAKVKVYEVTNEPNHHYFNASTSFEEYKKVLDSAREGILSVKEIANDKSIKIIGGGLAPGGNMEDWMTASKNTISDGQGIHPYGLRINQIDFMKRVVGKPIYLSEYGNSAYSPNQAALNADAIEKARRSGAKVIILYQLVKTPWKDWNTGVVDFTIKAPKTAEK